ncbi:DNA mismatch repair protein MutT [Clostridiaceae bacterium 14S0207]|nr:DNA mismatch repair protein MutT [Clostridiaceae bacterium 14S0207]
MKFKFCPICGRKLIYKYSWDEGNVPYCEKHKMLFFDVPKPCIVVAVIRDNEILLLKQSYIYKNSEILISGYVCQNETVEEAVHREVREETGINIKNIRYLGSQFLKDKEILMLTFMAFYDNGEISISKEVEQAKWRNIDNITSYMKEDIIGKKIIAKVIQELKID